MQTIVLRQLNALNQAATDLQAAAPTPAGRGWDATQDAAAITTMKEAWRRGSVAYAHIGAMLAPAYGTLEVPIAGRYDDFMKTLGAAGDVTPFDDQGVTGLHAIERILYAGSAPAFVVDNEKKIPGYKAAAFPATELEAADFKSKLCARLVTDSKAMVDQWGAGTVDLKVAFAGLTLLMNEQRDLLIRAAAGSEESRYSQQTLLDLQSTLEGTLLAYRIFQPWLLQGHQNPTDPTKHGPAHDKPIQAGFGDLLEAYTAIEGDALPQPPATWNAAAPSPEDLNTPFGHLYGLITPKCDPNNPKSIVAEMNIAATILGLK